MSILSTDMQAVLSMQVSDSNPAENGGRPGNTLLSLSAKNNVFADLDLIEPPAGPRWRKIFLLNLNAENLAALSPQVLLDSPTPGPDWVFFCPADFDGMQSAASGNADIYGAAWLAADAAAGATTVEVSFANAALAPMLQSGLQLLISTRPQYQNTTGSVGAEETVTISSLIVSVSDLSATLNLTAPLRNSYSIAQQARASVLYRPSGPIAPTLADWTETGSGHYDESGHPVKLNNRGTIRQNWTINYTSASAYTLTGDTLGLVGSYNTGTDAAPINPANFAAGQPYLIIQADGHGTAHVAGDRITFATFPAAIPIWVQQHFPASMDDYLISQIPLCWSWGSPE